jgi:hypothetical protein
MAEGVCFDTAEKRWIAWSSFNLLEGEIETQNERFCENV